jgi:circadian clock protein KaiB
MKEKKGVDGGAIGKGANVFRLYVTGASPNSSRAITNIKKVLDSCLKGKYELDIIDVYQQPQITKDVNIVALPLLVRLMPLPERRLIGDMSDGDRVIRSLGLKS